MTRKSPKPTRRLTLEGLETRNLMAGNVTVAVTDGVLHVQGDVEDNHVQIRAVTGSFSAWGGAKYEITGRSPQDSTTTTTTINGENSVVVSGVKNGAEVNLGHGNNWLRVAQLADKPDEYTTAPLPGEVTVRSGKGDDTIRLYVQNSKSVTINSGAGNDTIHVTRSRLKQLTINSDPEPPPGGTIGGGDRVLVSASATGFVGIYLGRNNKDGTADDLQIKGVGDSFKAGLSVQALGRSFVSLRPDGFNHFQILGNVNIKATDVVFTKMQFGGTVTVTGNNLNNSAEISDSTIQGQLTVSMLGGVDQLRIKNTSADSATLDGGAGALDEYVDDGGNELDETTITGFENPDKP